LGNQIALRKHLFPSLRPGACNGGRVYTDQMLPRKFLSQIKWDMLKNDIHYVKDCAAKNKTPSRKEILSIRGFMVYASATYDFIPPYLKGLQLSVEVWGPTRHSSGWAIRQEDYED
jgi:hypothetical protein